MPHAHRRRDGAPVHCHPPQTRSTCASTCGLRRSSIPKRLVCGGLERVYEIGAGYRQRGDQHAAQPRVHDARILPGVRDVRRPDGLHRVAAPRRGRTAGGRCRGRTPCGARRAPSRSRSLVVAFSMDRAVASGAERTANSAVGRGRGGARRRGWSSSCGGNSGSTSRSGRSRRPAPRASTGGTSGRVSGKCGERRRAALRLATEYVVPSPFLPDDYRSDDRQALGAVFIKDYPSRCRPSPGAPPDP